MLMRTDPFRELDRLTDAMFGTANRPTAMPMDAYRSGDSFVVHLDLPGVDADSIDLTVEKNVLTVRAERRPVATQDAERVVSERSFGVYSRQLFLGESLDVDSLTAEYDAGVLTIKLPVAEQAKPRKVQIAAESRQPQPVGASTGEGTR